MTFRLPDSSERVTINGRTGSGKTVFAAWLLSEAANFDEMPWTIIDYKGDNLLAALPAKRSRMQDGPPKEPGLYYMRPSPHQSDEMEDWLWKVWRKGAHGLFIDEGYMIPERRGRASTGGPFKTILTQGRSLQIPVYTLSQRPVDLNKHVFTEADFYACFHLNNKDDRDKITSYIHDNDVWDMDKRLPQYYSRWYDVKADFSAILKPVPSLRSIMRRFDERIKPRRRFL